MFKFFKYGNFQNKLKSSNFCTNENNFSDTIKKLFDLNIKTKKIPCFEVYSSQIEILNQPMDYYLAIIVIFIII
jgi:hypothetical protein